VVGPTGSGKTTLINDLELFADRNTPSGRQVLIDGAPAPAHFRDDPARNPIALITQHTTFLSDLPVRQFLETHLRIRGTEKHRAQAVFGIDATPAGSLVDTLGRPSRRLFALGPLLRATLWESTAIPEIRVQAESLAREWLGHGARRATAQWPASRWTSA
jgi:ABC-type sugar transport system ATPase subunit